jgi:hypothetical protein
MHAHARVKRGWIQDLSLAGAPSDRDPCKAEAELCDPRNVVLGGCMGEVRPRDRYSSPPARRILRKSCALNELGCPSLVRPVSA